MGNGIVAIEKQYGKNSEVMIVQEWAMNQKGLLAAKMVEKWGLITAMPDGEDSTGRARLRPATPEELVDHAMKCADFLVDACRDSGWILDLPIPQVERPGGRLDNLRGG